MLESSFKKSFLRHARKHGAHCQTIETTTGRGVPDVNLCVGGTEAWIEFKSLRCYDPLKGCPIRPEQVAWFTERRKAEGCVMLIVHHKDGSFGIYNGDRVAAWRRNDPHTWLKGSEYFGVTMGELWCFVLQIMRDHNFSLNV